MSNVVRMPMAHVLHSAIDERAPHLGEVTLGLLQPLEELGRHLQALDRELVRLRATADALNDRPEASALRQAFHPIRGQLVLAASQLAGRSSVLAASAGRDTEQPAPTVQLRLLVRVDGN